ncbi:hypothetical protein [Paraburkholderia translucens]|uniref:hypothetical protein n=1 Tax=Paraburkholderia translucens TaxID=2886945 RepID=UPI003CE4B397
MMQKSFAAGDRRASIGLRRDILIAQRYADVVMCCKACRTYGSLQLAPKSGTSAIDFDSKLWDGRVMNQSADGRLRYRWIKEDQVPFLEGLTGCHVDGTVLIPVADEFNSNRGLGVAIGNTREIIQHEQIEWIQRLMASSRASSRRESWSRCPRSEVRAKPPFQPDPESVICARKTNYAQR